MVSLSTVVKVLTSKSRVKFSFSFLLEKILSNDVLCMRPKWMSLVATIEATLYKN